MTEEPVNCCVCGEMVFVDRHDSEGDYREFNCENGWNIKNGSWNDQCKNARRVSSLRMDCAKRGIYVLPLETIRAVLEEEAAMYKAVRIIRWFQEDEASENKKMAELHQLLGETVVIVTLICLPPRKDGKDVDYWLDGIVERAWGPEVAIIEMDLPDELFERVVKSSTFVASEGKTTLRAIYLGSGSDRLFDHYEVVEQ